MKHTDSSPFLTPPKAIPVQIEIPMGTHHICQTCGNSHICDRAHCSLPLKYLCPDCGGTEPHSTIRAPKDVYVWESYSTIDGDYHVTAALDGEEYYCHFAKCFGYQIVAPSIIPKVVIEVATDLFNRYTEAKFLNPQQELF